MKKKILILNVILFFISCGMPNAKQINLKFATKKSKIPDNYDWKKIGFAKEIININDKIVVISGGDNPIPLSDWNKFEVFFPWTKNIDRNLLFVQTYLYRSPNSKMDCPEKECITQINYKGYSWIELAKPIAVDYIPDTSNTEMLKPDKGTLVIKTIQKCQVLMFKDTIYELTDNKGNFYVMHATEEKKPDLEVILPKGWSLQLKKIDKPLIVSPFGGGDNCYYNIIGDNLGQGYHQYIFADKFYPK